MSNVYRRTDSPYWWADYRTPEGRRVLRSTRCRDRAAAIRIAREWERAAEHEAADAAAGIERPSDLTVGDLARRYLAELMTDHHSPRTVESYGDHLRVYVLPYFGAGAVASAITRQGVEGFRRALLSGDLGSQRADRRRTSVPSAATVNRVMVTLRRLLDFGVRSGDLRENPAANLRPIRERPEDKFRALDDGELSALLAALRDRRRPDHAEWAAFIVATGLRDREVETLEWPDVDLARRYLRVRATKAKGARSRLVPLSDAAVSILEALPHRLGLVWGEHDRREALLRAWASTGLPGRAPTAHDLRNTCASRAAAAGLDLVQMMAMFAWLSPATAARYLHLYGGRLEDMARKLGGAG